MVYFSLIFRGHLISSNMFLMVIMVQTPYHKFIVVVATYVHTITSLPFLMKFCRSLWFIKNIYIYILIYIHLYIYPFIFILLLEESQIHRSLPPSKQYVGMALQMLQYDYFDYLPVFHDHSLQLLPCILALSAFAHHRLYPH